MTTGTKAADTLYGDAQNNVISGGRGDDTLYGEDGDDILTGGTGKDKLDGGNGSDTADYSQASEGIVANLNRGIALMPLYGAIAKPKIMPVGDSITAGQHRVDPTPGTYRIKLWDNFSSDGLSLDFVGSQSNGPDSLGDKDHEGHGGWKINAIAELIEDDLLETYQPDVILLQIGTNDTASRSVKQMSADLSNLIDLISQHSPKTQIFVSSIPPIDTRGSKGAENTRVEKVEDFNALLPTLIKNKVDQGKKVTFADIGGSLSVDDLVSDGVHPSADGYNKMGNRWYNTLVERDTLINIENIVGTAYKDTLTGDRGANVLEGGAGKDVLTGGGGIDTFVWRSPQHGKDTITDFSTNDFLQISAAGFGGGLIADTPLSLIEATTGVFVSGSNPLAIGNSANFLYDTDTGRLSFDSDGSGDKSTVTLAKFKGLPALSLEQFQIVA